jgi:T-complex protein 1 subunit theta
MAAPTGSLMSLLKKGARHYQGEEEAVIRNITACKEMAAITRTSLGPQGMNKMVIDSHDKLIVTNDAVTMLKVCSFVLFALFFFSLVLVCR